MMATASTDEYVKIWDIGTGSTPKMIGYRKMEMGELFSVQYYADIPWILAAGGSLGTPAVWDTEENDKIKSHFLGNLDLSAKE